MEVTCPGCSNAFSKHGGGAPKLLECGHSFCVACLKQMAGAEMRLVRCTTCRKSSVIQAGIEGLPFNFALLDVLPTEKGGNKTKPDKEKGGDTSESAADAYLKVVAVGESNVGKSWLSQKYLVSPPSSFVFLLGDLQSSSEKLRIPAPLFPILSLHANGWITRTLRFTSGTPQAKSDLGTSFVEFLYQQHPRSLVRTYFRGADGVLLVYSVADRESFQKIDQWMEEVKASSYVLVESRKLTVPCLDVMLFYRCKKIHNTNQPSFWWEAKRMRSAKYQRNKGERKPRGWAFHLRRPRR